MALEVLVKALKTLGEGLVKMLFYVCPLVKNQ